MNFFSIVTSTYNRSSHISRLYDSLIKQGDGFEWIIIDDGSTDDTELLVRSWINAGIVNIKYIKIKNGGKHRAINKGLKIATSLWTVIIDSDDWLIDDGLLMAKNIIEKHDLKNADNVAGVIFNSKKENGDPVGSIFPHDEYFGKTFSYYNKYKVYGDKCSFYKTNILKANPFPEIDDERFIAESILWNRINSNYTCLFVNKFLQFVEYQSDGLSSKSLLLRSENPSGACLLYYERFLLCDDFLSKLVALTNYFRFLFHGGREINIRVNKIKRMLCVVLGYILFRVDEFRL